MLKRTEVSLDLLASEHVAHDRGILRHGRQKLLR